MKAIPGNVFKLKALRHEQLAARLPRRRVLQCRGEAIEVGGEVRPRQKRIPAATMRWGRR